MEGSQMDDMDKECSIWVQLPINHLCTLGACIAISLFNVQYTWSNYCNLSSYTLWSLVSWLWGSSVFVVVSEFFFYASEIPVLCANTKQQSDPKMDGQPLQPIHPLSVINNYEPLHLQLTIHSTCSCRCVSILHNRWGHKNWSTADKPTMTASCWLYPWSQ